MAKLHHVYVTAHGEYTTSAWVGEYAQIGIRLAVEPEASLPSKGSIFTPFANHGDVALDSGTQAGTNGTLTKTWTARIGDTGSLENADGAWQADLGDDMWTFLNSVKALQSNVFRWTHVKVSPILATGKYGAPAATYQFTSPLVGAVTGNATPPELAVAVSLRAGILGRRGRGRMYIPALAVTTISGTDGTLVSANATTLATALKTLVTNFEDAPGTEVMTPLVMVTSAGSAEGVRPSQVRVGNHFDVQRRRQAQIKETYTTQAL